MSLSLPPGAILSPANDQGCPSPPPTSHLSLHSCQGILGLLAALNGFSSPASQQIPTPSLRLSSLLPALPTGDRWVPVREHPYLVCDCLSGKGSQRAGRVRAGFPLCSPVPRAQYQSGWCFYATHKNGGPQKAVSHLSGGHSGAPPGTEPSELRHMGREAQPLRCHRPLGKHQSACTWGFYRQMNHSFAASPPSPHRI